MTNAELLAKIKAEIDKLYSEYKDKFHQSGDQYHLGLIDGLDMAERVLDTLESEKPIEELEEEIDLYLEKNYDYNSEYDTLTPNDGFFFSPCHFRNLARHFAKWGADHTPLPEDTVIYQKGVEEGKRLMMDEAVEGYVNYYEDSGGILMAEAQVGCPYHNGDKVKIIIVKEEGGE